MSEVLKWNESFMFQVTTSTPGSEQNSESTSPATMNAARNRNSVIVNSNNGPAALKVHVYSRKFLAKDTHLGTIIIPLNTLSHEGVTKQWYRLPEVDGIQGSIMLKLQYSASDRGRMNLLQELVSDKHYEKLSYALSQLSTRSFVTMFDHNNLIPSTTEIDSLLKFIVSSETTSVNRNTVLKLLVNSEVKASASSVGTLFRRNSLCSKILTSFLNYYGDRYLHGRLQSFVQTLNEEDLDLEVDPHRVNPDTQKVDTKKNMKLILKKTEQLIKEILEAPNEVPYEIRESNAILAQAVSQVFAKENKNNTVVHTAVGGAMFLRFICPALTSPHLYGLLNGAPKRRAHRTLMIVTKILQNLANGVEFGKKEDFMTKANKLIKKQKKPFVKFVEAVISQNLTPSVGDDIDQIQMLWSMYNIHGYLSKNWQKIIEDLTTPKDNKLPFSILENEQTSDSSQILKELSSVKQVLDTLGEPIELKKKT